LKVLDKMAQIDVPKSEKAGLIISRANTLVKLERYREALRHYNDFLHFHCKRCPAPTFRSVT